jgi:molybdopterin molybdotransferase/putative molybdopterin biosynthesis protein
MVRHMLLEMGAEPRMFPIMRDNPAELKKNLQEALKLADVVLLNGGSSKGAEDYNARLLEELGQMVCCGVKAAPGRPLGIALVDNKPVINLPGPTLATWLGMDWCIPAIVNHAMGIAAPVRPKVKAVLTEEIEGPNMFPTDWEIIYRMAVTRTKDGYEAWPVPFGRVEGKRTYGFHSGLYIHPNTHALAKGSEIEVEILYSPEFI